MSKRFLCVRERERHETTIFAFAGEEKWISAFWEVFALVLCFFIGLLFWERDQKSSLNFFLHERKGTTGNWVIFFSVWTHTIAPLVDCLIGGEIYVQKKKLAQLTPYQKLFMLQYPLVPCYSYILELEVKTWTAVPR